MEYQRRYLSVARSLVAGVIFLLGLSLAHAQTLAFPEAEGYGKYTMGGRGGAIYEVTNLNDSGAGSLRAAVEASGPRIVVFRVGGTIYLNSNLTIDNPYITIAGQTAPGGGITIARYTFGINADQVIVRYIRARYGDAVQIDADAVSMRYKSNIILDHVSASWGDDETMSLYHGKNVTVQWSIISETLNRGGSHGFAGIWGSPNSTFHHNLIAHCTSRNMRFASGGGNTDFRNNVIYNWQYNSAYGGEQQQPGNASFNTSTINIVGNYYKPGPATQAAVNHRIVNPTYRDVKTDYGKFYVAGNYVVGNATVTADNWNGGVDPQGGSGDLSLVRLTSPWDSMALAGEQTAQDAYQSVLAHAGSSKPGRDSVDARIIDEVSSGTATYGTSGVITSQSEVGGWPTLAIGSAPTDTDRDGMPDSWETARGLDPYNAADRNNDLDSDGYTNVEEYLNELGAPVAADNITWGVVQNITDDSDVNTGGTLVRAANLTKSGGTYDTNITVNGVTFVRSPYTGTTTTLANGDTLVTSDSSAIGAFEGFGGATPPFTSLSTNYQQLLRSGHYNDGDLANPSGTARITLTLRNLTIGAQYRVQIWSNDYRVVNLGQSNPGLMTHVADFARTVSLEHNINNALGGRGQFVIGTFTATSTTKAITLTGGNTGTDTSAPNCSGIWNAYQLRRL